MQERDRQEAAPVQPGSRRSSSTVIKVVVALVLLILFIVFVAQNSEAVTVDLVFVTARVRLIWVFVGCALIGALVAALLGRPGRQTSRRYIRELERRLADAERPKD